MSPKVKNFKKEVRTAFLKCAHAFQCTVVGDLSALLRVEIVDLSLSLLLSSDPDCQSWTWCQVELYRLHGRAQRNHWPCSESWAEPCQGQTSCFCLTQTVQCHHFMSGFIFYLDIFHLHIIHSTNSSSVSLCTLFDLQNAIPHATENNFILTDCGRSHLTRQVNS